MGWQGLGQGPAQGRGAGGQAAGGEVRMEDKCCRRRLDRNKANCRREWKVTSVNRVHGRCVNVVNVNVNVNAVVFEANTVVFGGKYSDILCKFSGI